MLLSKKMLPRSSSAQMEGCGEDGDAHIQSEVNRFNLLFHPFLCSLPFSFNSVHHGPFVSARLPWEVIIAPAGVASSGEPDPSLNLPFHSPFRHQRVAVVVI